MSAFEEKFSALAHELLKMMKEYDLFIVSWEPEPSLAKYGLYIDMVTRKQIKEGHHILSDDEIMKDEGALNHLFSWGVALAMSEDE